MDDIDTNLRDEEYELIKGIQRQAKSNYVEGKDLTIPSSDLFDLATILENLLKLCIYMEEYESHETHCVSAIKRIKRILDDEGV